MGKVRTLWDYIKLGFNLGADRKSRWRLALMLPHLKLMRALNLLDERIWQVRLKFGEGAIPLLLRTSDIFILKEVWGEDVYCPKWLRDSPISSILDLGAHIGLTTLRFKLCFPNTTIHAYEPDPENYQILCLNTEMFKDIVAHAEAVGSVSGEAIFYVRPQRHTASSLVKPSDAKQVIEVQCTVRSLDDILEHIGGADLIKFDIEGVEREVFAASRRVHEVPYLVGEIKGKQEDIEQILALFSNHKAEVRSATPKIHYIYLRRLKKISSL
jgi:FkbM family methyltransferase